MIELGKRIKRRRIELGMTQTEVAVAANRSHPWLVGLENGKGNPPAEAITAVAVKLKEDPRVYLSLAGRVSLTAENLRPAMPGELSPEQADAVERAVSRALAPLLERLDRLLTLTDERQGAR